MELFPAALLLGAAPLIAHAIWSERKAQRALDAGRSELGATLGLHYERSGRRGTLAGTLGGLSVSVEWTKTRKGELAHYRVKGLPKFVLRAEGLTANVLRAFGRHDTELGDSEFDGAVFLADELVGAMFLDPELRQRARWLVLNGGSAHDGELSLVSNEGEVLVDTERRLHELNSLAGALMDRWRNFPDLMLEAVQRGWRPELALRLLIQRYGSSPQAQEALVVAKTSERIELQLWSAIGRSDAAWLRTCARDEGAPLSARLEALTFLRKIGPSQMDVSFEPLLLKLLTADELPARRVAARTLGLCGSVAAVAPLLAVAESWSGDAELIDTARRAIAAIQARLAGADAGQLALVDGPKGGELSEPKGAGALSLPHNKDGSG